MSTLCVKQERLTSGRETLVYRGVHNREGSRRGDAGKGLDPWGLKHPLKGTSLDFHWCEGAGGMIEVCFILILSKEIGRGSAKLEILLRRLKHNFLRFPHFFVTMILSSTTSGCCPGWG